MSDANHCANCGRAVDGPAGAYCPGCGQPVPAPRIDWRFLAREFEHGVLNMDRGLLYTVRMLMLRPGRLIRDYLGGRRAGHVKPLWLVMVTAALVVFLTRYVPGTDGVIGQFSAGYQAGVDASPEADPNSAAMIDAFQSVSGWVGRNFAATTLILLPLEAAIFKLAFWRVKGLNYPEWLTIISFLTAQAFLVWSCFALIGRWLPAAQDWVMWGILAYMLFSLMHAFDDYPRWKTLARGVVGFGLYLVANMVILMAISVAFVAISASR